MSDKETSAIDQSAHHPVHILWDLPLGRTILPRVIEPNMQRQQKYLKFLQEGSIDELFSAKTSDGQIIRGNFPQAKGKYIAAIALLPQEPYAWSALFNLYQRILSADQRDSLNYEKTYLFGNREHLYKQLEFYKSLAGEFGIKYSVNSKGFPVVLMDNPTMNEG